MTDRSIRQNENVDVEKYQGLEEGLKNDEQSGPDGNGSKRGCELEKWPQ